MEPQERLMLNLRDFFEETALPLRLPVPPSEAGDSCDPHDRPFNFDDTFVPLAAAPPADIAECLSMREDHYIEDTSPFDDLLSYRLPLLHSQRPPAMEEFQNGEGNQPSEEELEAMIGFLVENAHLGRSELEAEFCARFGGWWECGVVQTLVGRFAGLKKTREELVKYCMRKAFKFILELPKNEHLLECPLKEEKFSFAKSKSRFLKKVSAEKSMNNTFLAQIFREGDFAADYALFLEQFEGIMREDNRKKVKFLAWLLTHRQEGKQRTVEMIRRMPWTAALLQRTRRISLDLLKFSPA